MATYAGEIVTRFGADLSGLSRGFQQAESMGRSYSSQMERHTSRVSSSFSGMGRSVLGSASMLAGWGLAAGAAVGGAVALGGALLSSNASMEQTTIAFKGLLGSGQAADKMLRELQAFAAKTPFEFPELAKDTQMLIGMGVASRDVIPWMTAIGDAAAGVGAGTEGVEQITRAMGQMQAKTKISGEEMMQLTEAGIPAWRILASSMGLSVAQVQELSQKGQLGQDAINKLVAGMEKMYGGQMKNQATTFNGLLSTLKDNAGMALRAFTGPLFEAAKNGLKLLTDYLGSPAFQSFAAGAAKWIADAFQRIGQFIGPVVSEIGSFIGTLTSGNGPASQFGGILQQVAGIFAGNFLDVIEQVSGFVTNNLIPAIQALSPTFQRIGDLFTGTIIPAFIQIWPVVNQVASAIRTVFLAALSAILPVIVNLANFLSSLIVPAFKFLAPYVVMAAKEVGKFASQVGGQLVPLLQQLGGTLNGIVNFLKGVFIAIWPTLGPIVGAAFQVVVSVIKTAWALISGVIKTALALLRGDWSGAWNSLKDMLGGVWEGIKGIIGNALQAILGILGAIFGPIVAMFQNIWNKAKEIWNNIWNTITGFMGRIWHSIIDPWQPIITFITDVGRIIWGIISMGWNVIWTTISGALSRIWNTIVSVWNTISGFIGGIIKTIWDTEVRGWTNIWNSISGFLTRIWNTITTIWNTIKNFLGSVLGAILSTVSSIWNTIWQRISGFVTNIWNTVTSVFNRIRDTVGGIFRAAINNIIGFLRGGQQAIANFVNFFVDKINAVSQAIIQKNLLSRVNIQLVPFLAKGSKSFAGGLAVVGEEGAELVYLPRGAQVLPAKQTQDVLHRSFAPLSNQRISGFQGGVGDVIGTVLSAITGGISGIVDSLLKNVFSGMPGLGFLSGLAGGLLGKIASFFAEWIQKNITSLFATGPLNLPMAQRGQFILPPGGGFGQQYWYGVHQGMDFQFPQGSPLHEVVGGRVMPATGWYAWGGELVVQIMNGLWERYLHLSSIFAKAGDQVSRGQLVGLTGGGTPASGLGYWSTGAHLHIQYSQPGSYTGIDPLRVWASLGIFKPFAKGGILSEKVMGFGQTTGKPYLFGEGGPEQVSPLATSTSRMIDLLEQIKHLLSQDNRVSEYQIVQALGKLLTNGVR